MSNGLSDENFKLVRRAIVRTNDSTVGMMKPQQAKGEEVVSQLDILFNDIKKCQDEMKRRDSVLQAQRLKEKEAAKEEARRGSLSGRKVDWKDSLRSSAPGVSSERRGSLAERRGSLGERRGSSGSNPDRRGSIGTNNTSERRGSQNGGSAKDRRSSLYDSPDRRSSIYDTNNRRSSLYDAGDRRKSLYDSLDRRGSSIDNKDRRGSQINAKDRRSSLYGSLDRRGSNLLDSKDRRGSTNGSTNRFSTVNGFSSKNCEVHGNMKDKDKYSYRGSLGNINNINGSSSNRSSNNKSGDRRGSNADSGKFWLHNKKRGKNSFDNSDKMNGGDFDFSGRKNSVKGDIPDELRSILDLPSPSPRRSSAGSDSDSKSNPDIIDSKTGFRRDSLEVQSKQGYRRDSLDVEAMLGNRRVSLYDTSIMEEDEAYPSKSLFDRLSVSPRSSPDRSTPSTKSTSPRPSPARSLISPSRTSPRSSPARDIPQNRSSVPRETPPRATSARVILGRRRTSLADDAAPLDHFFDGLTDISLSSTVATAEDADRVKVSMIGINSKQYQRFYLRITVIIFQNRIGCT